MPSRCADWLRHAAAAGIGLLLATGPALAGTTDLASCAACHGAAGQSSMAGVPSLGGQPAQYLLIQLVLFRDRVRQVAAMNSVVEGLSDEALESLASVLSDLPPPVPATPLTPDSTREQHAAALVTAHRCTSCHGARFDGQEGVPRLAAQREDYVARTLREYKHNIRPGYDATMAEVLQPLSDADLDELAWYVSSRPVVTAHP
jgi:cytochrome c553